MIFWFIGIDDWNTAHAYDPILGIQKLHSIYAMNQYDVNELMVRELACFCCFCMERQWYACLYVQWTKDWRLETLKPTYIQFVRSIMEEEMLIGIMVRKEMRLLLV